jgi:hypothetical protein
MKKEARDSGVFLPEPTEWTPACLVGVACHIRKCGICVTQTLSPILKLKEAK